jgi:probable phosphoglycerate mutase
MSTSTLAPPPAPDLAPAGAATTILIVRHAEVHNPERLLYGRLPKFGLSRYGEEQAERTAAFLAGRPLAAIYSSPLLRARQTAARIARHHPAARRRVTRLLHEVGTAWQGTPFAQFAPGFSAYEQPRAAGDESLEDIRARMVAFLDRARRRHPRATVVGVSHGDPIAILRVTLSGRPLTPAALRGADYPGLGSVTEIVFAPDEERPRVTPLTVPWTAST